MNWTGKKLKKAAKRVLKNQYWKLVFVSLIIFAAVNGGAAGTGSSFQFNKNFDFEEEEQHDFEPEYASAALGQNVLSVQSSAAGFTTAGLLSFAAVLLTVVLLVSFAVTVVMEAFVFYPLEAGARRCTVKAYDEKFPLSELGFIFKNSYLKNVKTLFLRGLYTFLWTLCFWIPGIVKRYEYKMIPFIVSDNPDISTRDAFAMSKNMMKGQKWKAFLLDLSFIGWHLLSSLSLLVFSAALILYIFDAVNTGVFLACMGSALICLPLLLLAVLFVNPYKYLTVAGLYRALKKNESDGDFGENGSGNGEIQECSSFEDSQILNGNCNFQ